MAILASAAILLVYVGVILATIKLRKMKVQDSFTIPGGITVPLLALVATGWFLSHLAKNEILAAMLYLIFFSVVYWISQILRKQKRKPDENLSS
jgi:L-asparagine transporter-like permease